MTTTNPSTPAPEQRFPSDDPEFIQRCDDAYVEHNDRPFAEDKPSIFETPVTDSEKAVMAQQAAGEFTSTDLLPLDREDFPTVTDEFWEVLKRAGATGDTNFAAEMHDEYMEYHRTPPLIDRENFPGVSDECWAEIKAAEAKGNKELPSPLYNATAGIHEESDDTPEDGNADDKPT